MERSDDEAVWIRQSQAGDPLAFAALVNCYQRMIHTLTFRMTGSQADAEDLAQETFIRAYRQLRSYRGEAKFASWLYRIGINACLNWQKSRQRRAAMLEAFARQDTSPGNTDEITAKVQAALLKLSPKERAAIILTVYDEMNHAAAARVLGCTEVTVSWRVHMARKKLKELLQCA